MGFFPKRWRHINVIIYWQARNRLLLSLADIIIFQTLMNVRTQASTIVVRTPSALIAQEATFVHAHQDFNRQTQPMEKISHVQVSWLRYNLRHRWSTESVKIALIQKMCRNATYFYNWCSILVQSFIFKFSLYAELTLIVCSVLGNCQAMSSLSVAHLLCKSSICCSNSRISHEL